MKFSRALDFDPPKSKTLDRHLKPTEKVYCSNCKTLMAVCGSKPLTHFCLNCECTDLNGDTVLFVMDKFCPVCRKKIYYK